MHYKPVFENKEGHTRHFGRYGDGAGLHATQRADELLAAGDMDEGASPAPDAYQ